MVREEDPSFVPRADRVGSSIPVKNSRFAPVSHVWPMMSLDNAFSPEDVTAWATRLAKVLEDEGAIPRGESAKDASRISHDLAYVAEVSKTDRYTPMSW